MKANRRTTQRSHRRTEIRVSLRPPLTIDLSETRESLLKLSIGGGTWPTGERRSERPGVCENDRVEITGVTNEQAAALKTRDPVWAWHQNVLTSYDWLEATVTKEPDMNLQYVVVDIWIQDHHQVAGHIRPLINSNRATRRAAEQTNPLGEGKSDCELDPYKRDADTSRNRTV